MHSRYFINRKKSPRADFRRAHAHLFRNKNSLLYLTTDDAADFLDLPCKYRRRGGGFLCRSRFLRQETSAAHGTSRGDGRGILRL